MPVSILAESIFEVEILADTILARDETKRFTAFDEIRLELAKLADAKFAKFVTPKNIKLDVTALRVAKLAEVMLAVRTLRVATLPESIFAVRILAAIIFAPAVSMSEAALTVVANTFVD